MRHEDINGDQISPAGKGLTSRFRGVQLLAASASVCFFLLSSSVVTAQPCGTPALTGNFAAQPCGLPPPPIPPGSQFQTYLQTWDAQLLAAYKAMTANLYSYRIWQTLDFAGLMDAEDVNHNARLMQEQRVTAKLGNLPDDQTCVAGSSPVPETEAALTAAALTQGFKQDILRRAHNAVETQTGNPPSYAPPGMTPASDVNARWTEFCKEFNDPNSNGGQGACQGGPAGTVPNDDISVEGLLLRDTIDLNNPDLYKASEALLINIIQPVIQERINDNLLNSQSNPVATASREHVLRQQHLEAIRNIAADVVGSIISRRAPIPQTNPPLVTQQIVDIRTKAGIPPCQSGTQTPNGPCSSTTPSYNEIMLALTKERFFDPVYFSSMETNPGAIQQEQDAVDGYTTVQLQDIYKMQEQINTLLAARASLKLATDQSNSETSAAPTQ